MVARCGPHQRSAWIQSEQQFPARYPEHSIFVIDPTAQTVATRSLTNLVESGMTQTQIDLLSVTAAQWCQSKDTLYMSGGYGVDESGTNFTTKDALTAIDIPGLMHWVVSPTNGETAAQYVRQIFDPIFQITGGVMVESSPNHVLLVFGQNFEGSNLFTPDVTYSEQVRRVPHHGEQTTLLLSSLRPSLPPPPNPDYRRAVLNVVPIIERGRPSFVALSGAFTTNSGIWTIPVEISSKGVPTEASPTNATTFMQGMNNFNCPTLELYSHKEKNSYTVLMGGLSYGYFRQCDVCDRLRTAIHQPGHDDQARWKRRVLAVPDERPVSSDRVHRSNPGNPLLFGASATFIPAPGLPTYGNGVLNYDKLGTTP